MTERRLFLFRTVVWLLWLLSTWGLVQYTVHAWYMLQLLERSTGEHVRLCWALVWDVVCMLLAGLTSSAATGVLLWRAWARLLLRWLVFALAAYALLSGVMLFVQWWSFDHCRSELLMPAAEPELRRLLMVQITRTSMVSLVLKALSIPLLAWLGWCLGSPLLVRRFGA